jgi:hypothetical protein
VLMPSLKDAHQSGLVSKDWSPKDDLVTQDFEFKKSTTV